MIWTKTKEYIEPTTAKVSRGYFHSETHAWFSLSLIVTPELGECLLLNVSMERPTGTHKASYTTPLRNEANKIMSFLDRCEEFPDMFTSEGL